MPGRQRSKSCGSWVSGFCGRITVCDRDGTILEMNAQAAEGFATSGGPSLVGCNVLDCHPEPARSQLRSQLETGQVNAYTIEKDGEHRFIYQAPWYEEGEYCGLVELSLEIPHPLRHMVRDRT